jgi:hypothetical protein
MESPNTNTNKYFPIIINTLRDGGYSFSNAAIDEYNKRQNELIATYALSPNTNQHLISRTDPIMMQIMKDMGFYNASGYCSTLSICQVPKKYENHYTIGIDNVTGEETWSVPDLKQYKLDCIRDIVKRKPSGSFELIQDILDEEIEEIII